MAVRNLFCNFFPSSFQRGKREFGIRANDFDDFGYTGDVVYFISVNYFILVLMLNVCWCLLQTFIGLVERSILFHVLSVFIRCDKSNFFFFAHNRPRSRNVSTCLIAHYRPRI